MYRVLFISLFVGLTFTQCKKDQGETIDFLALTEIPAGLNTVFTHNFEMEAYGTLKSGFQEASPNYARLYLEQGAGNFDFVRDATLNIKREDGTLLEIAYYERIPARNSRSIELLPSIADIKEYISEDKFKLVLKLRLRYVTQTNSRIRVNFGVQARR